MAQQGQRPAPQLALINKRAQQLLQLRREMDHSLRPREPEEADRSDRSRAIAIAVAAKSPSGHAQGAAPVGERWVTVLLPPFGVVLHVVRGVRVPAPRLHGFRPG